MKNNLTPVQELDTSRDARMLEKLDQMDDFVAHMRVTEPFYPSENGALLDLDKVLSVMDEYASITIAEFYKKVGLENELNTTNDIALEVYSTHGWSTEDTYMPEICPCFIKYTGAKGYIISMPKPHLL